MTTSNNKPHPCSDEANKPTFGYLGATELKEPASDSLPTGQKERSFVVRISDYGHYLGVFQIWDQDGNEITHEEEKRLQKLFEGAQGLLKACKEFVRKCDTAEAKSKRFYAQMKVAISKAEGRS